MVDRPRFDWEDVFFIHDDEEFIYSFHRFDNGKISFKKLVPNAPAGQEESEVVIYPGGKKHLANTAVIVLYKGVASGQPLTGFLPNILHTMLDMYISEEGLKTNLEKSIASFQVTTPIADVDKVLEFVLPYAPWRVSD